MAKAGINGATLAVSLLEQSPDCVKLLSTEGQLEYINCNGIRAMEIGDAGMVLGKLWWDLWPESVRGDVRAAFESAVKGERQRFVAECPTFKGELRRWLVDLKPLMEPSGPVVSVLANSRDVTTS